MFWGRKISISSIHLKYVVLLASLYLKGQDSKNYVHIYLHVYLRVCICIYVCISVQGNIYIHINVCMYVITPPLWVSRMRHKPSFKAEFNRFYSELSISYTGWYDKPNLPCFLPVAGGRIVRFIDFSIVLALCKKQTALSRIWTQALCQFLTTITMTPWAYMYACMCVLVCVCV